MVVGKRASEIDGYYRPPSSGSGGNLRQETNPKIRPMGLKSLSAARLSLQQSAHLDARGEDDAQVRG